MFLALAEKRRSTRAFQEKKIDPELVDIIMESALRAPSSKGINSCEFILIQDPEMLEKLSRSKPQGSAFLKGAPLGIVVCADTARSDLWIENAAITSTFILLSAESLGLGACWIHIRERMHDPETPAGDYIAGLLGIPRGIEVEAIIAVGYPRNPKAPRRKEDLDYDRLFIDRYGNRTPKT